MRRSPQLGDIVSTDRALFRFQDDPDRERKPDDCVPSIERKLGRCGVAHIATDASIDFTLIAERQEERSHA